MGCTSTKSSEDLYLINMSLCKCIANKTLAKGSPIWQCLGVMDRSTSYLRGADQQSTFQQGALWLWINMWRMCSQGMLWYWPKGCFSHGVPSNEVISARGVYSDWKWPQQEAKGHDFRGIWTWSYHRTVN